MCNTERWVTMCEYKLIVIFMNKIEVKSESVEATFEVVIDNEGDRSPADYADAALIPADEVEYEG
jgi:hypothetical protein